MKDFFLIISRCVFPILLSFPWLFLVEPATAQQGVWPQYPNTVNSNSMTVNFKIYGQPPEFMAAIVETNDPMEKWQKDQQKAIKEWMTERQTNSQAKHPVLTPAPVEDFNTKAQWIPFQSNLLIDLGSGDGNRTVKFGFRYAGETGSHSWSGSTVTVKTRPPFIGITYPQQTAVYQPTILLKGYSSEPLLSIRYDVLDQKGHPTVSNQEGFVNDQHYDTELLRITTNYFTCYDIALTAGKNTIVLRCQDDAGNSISTNFTFVLNTKQNRPPPVISIDWPQPKITIPAGDFTVRGKLDDGTENIAGSITANGQTNAFNGAVEWSHSIDGAGYFWIEHLPISVGTNYLTLTATNSAGISTSTNLILYGKEEPVIAMDPVTPADKLYQPYVDITGRVSPVNNDVWINGVKATVNPDGTWQAKQVPVVSANGGTACFDMTSIPRKGTTENEEKPGELFYAQANLGTNAIILNPSAPVCGVFRLHVNNDAKLSFILLASTNLTDWAPILTNSTPDTTFDYTDRDVNSYSCHFFRVTPLQ